MAHPQLLGALRHSSAFDHEIGDRCFALVTLSQQGIPLGDTGVYFPKGLVAAVSATAYNNVAAPSAAAFVTFAVD